MKKYRVTNLHPILKEGLILTCEETVYGAPAYSLTTADGVESPIAFMHDLRVESHPTWYEEVKEVKKRTAEECLLGLQEYVEREIMRYGHGRTVMEARKNVSSQDQRSQFLFFGFDNVYERIRAYQEEIMK